MCLVSQSSSMGGEEVVRSWVKIISAEICKKYIKNINNRKWSMGFETRKYIRRSNNTAVLEVPVLFSFSYYSHVFRWRFFTIYFKKTINSRRFEPHVPSMLLCQIKVIDLWRLRSHVSSPNFKPHLLCVAMSKSTSSTMPVTQVQVFLICFRFSPPKFSPDVAFYFLKLWGIFFS